MIDRSRDRLAPTEWRNVIGWSFQRSIIEMLRTRFHDEMQKTIIIENTQNETRFAFYKRHDCYFFLLTAIFSNSYDN